ncbi:MAG: hypothetical protein E4H37_08170, partial [Gemmatimonadales bacterium]
MAKQLDVTLATDWVAAGEVASLPVLQTAITGALFGDIDRDHFAVGTNPIVSSATAPSTPATGLGWHNTSNGVVSYWSGSEWIAGVTYATSAPNATGTPWYDQTLKILRAYDTIDGITGWHPVSTGYQLMDNRSGGTVTANKVVVRSTDATSNRCFTTTTVVKDQSVVGVLLEETVNNAPGVVAMVAGGAVVDILADDGAADGAIAKGDGLVSYSESGECRTVGPLGSTAILSATLGSAWYAVGVPLGCFAEALGTKDATTHLVRARLLGSVGTGRRVVLQSDNEIYVPVHSATVAHGDAGTTLDLDSPATGTVIQNSKHLPTAVASLHVHLETTIGAGGIAENVVVVSSTQDAVGDYSLHASGYHGNASLSSWDDYFDVMTVDSVTA